MGLARAVGIRAIREIRAIDSILRAMDLPEKLGSVRMSILLPCGKLPFNFWCLRLVLALALVGRAEAVDPGTSLSQLNHTSWPVKDGAPSRIGAIARISPRPTARFLPPWFWVSFWRSSTMTSRARA